MDNKKKSCHRAFVRWHKKNNNIAIVSDVVYTNGPVTVDAANFPDNVPGKFANYVGDFTTKVVYTRIPRALVSLYLGGSGHRTDFRSPIGPDGAIKS